MFRVPNAADVDARERDVEKRVRDGENARNSTTNNNVGSLAPPTISVASDLPTASQLGPSMASASTVPLPLPLPLPGSTTFRPPPSTSAANIVPHRLNAIRVNSQTQRGNPVLKFVTNVPYEYVSDIAPDFVLGRTTCALYLSVRYHRLHPDYIYDRVKKLGAQSYDLRVLLVHVDDDNGGGGNGRNSNTATIDHRPSLRELARLCIISRLTLIVAWSLEEAGRYLETYKAYENKGAELLRGRRADATVMEQVTDFLTAVKGVNKTDVVTLLARFGSVRGIVLASPEEMAELPGFGEQKIRRLQEAFHRPFLVQNNNNNSGGVSYGEHPQDEDAD